MLLCVLTILKGGMGMWILQKIERNFEKAIITLFLITMSIFIFIQVISRYVFGNAFTWTEELSRYMFIWLIYLAIGIGFRENRHISIDVVVDALPEKMRKIVKQVNYIFLFALSCFFVWEGYVLVVQMQMFGQVSANMQIPMWLVYLSLPVGFVFTAVRLLQASIDLWKTRGEVNE